MKCKRSSDARAHDHQTLNPDETVWALVKQDVSRRLVENKEHMKQLALSVLRRLQKLPILIMYVFRQPECRYILE
jgi:hypothetical protein